MADALPKCQCCGEPLTPGHEVTVAHRFRDDADGYWISISLNGMPYDEVGPFDTAEEREAAHIELVAMMQSFGARTVPATVQ